MMKKELAFLSVLIFVLVLSVSFVSSFDIPLSKTSYYPGETMQVEIPNIFITNPTISNILIYAKNAVHSSPAKSGLIKYDTKYHFYALLPTEPGDYQLRIEGVKYWDGSVQSEQPIVADFSIVSTNQSYLSFDPGYIYTSSGFSINLRAYNQDQEVNVELPEMGFKDTFNMGYGDTKTVYITVSGIQNTIKSNIKINSYNIPVVIIAGSIAPSNNQTNTTPGEGNQTLKDLIASDTENINGTILSGIDYYYQIVIVNKNQNVLNIKLASSDPEIKVSPVFIDSLYKEQVLNITVNTGRDINGYVRLSTNDGAMTIPITLKITQKQNDTSTNVQPVNEEKKCANFGGIICVSNEKCTGSRTSSVDSPEGNCCIGDCNVPSSSSKWIIGVIILIVLGLGVWFLYKKANKGEGPEFLQKIFQKKTTDYQRRMNPIQTTSAPELRRSLEKT